ncbi:methyltransferase domain-containing protein [Hydrogenophaga sp. UC242_50]|uniref:methyltransferase domain-containing protein n=1 Tax=unclassified Hydrogenophaga TaxID=2610897 RepID=UPI0036D43DE8
MKTAGRNDPCPCLSGKKHKHCCLAGGGGVPAPQADALHRMGLWALEAGDAAAALDHLTRATLARPRFPEAHYHLGLLHMQQGLLDQAAVHYRQAIAIAPGFLQAHANLGVVFNRQGQPLQALDCFLQALSIHEAVEVKIGVAECLQRLPLQALQRHLRPVLARAIAEAWRRPEELARAASALILCEPHLQGAIGQEGPMTVQALAPWREDRLLLALLESATVCDVVLERCLTQARAALLAEALAPVAPEEGLWALRGALARQCFINEYAWVRSAPETGQLAQLQARINATLDTGGLPQAHELLALASYRPLHTLAHADALSARPWPEALRAVMRQQIDDVREEERLRERLPRLTTIGENTSCRVRRQYEENPYPRWTRPSLFPAPLSLDDRLRGQVPQARFQPLGERRSIDILVAGCGTGRHSTETANHYRGAQVLAIDLSARSLAYAMRQARALGLARIEYAQADLLQLGAIDRRFDLIESVGVLHHLAEPEAGWRALLPLLRPGGLMLIGLYSELARAPVVAARRFIAERGFPATADGIRDARAALMACDGPEALRRLTTFGDFFGLSACRDLLFHEQEHRTTLPAIQALLRRLGLDFVGLHVEPTVRQRFRARFPDEGAAHDLGLWHRYETEHPETFVGMYQFWVQKRA